MKNCLFLLVILLTVSCQQAEEKPTQAQPTEVLEFYYGLQCGWATYDDAIRINQDSISMQVLRSSPPPNGTQIDTTLATPPQLWQGLVDSLNWGNFTALNINTFHLGADGCDYFLQIQKDTAVHAIRYGLNDKLPGIRPLLNQLDSTWAQVGPWPPFN